MVVDGTGRPELLALVAAVQRESEHPLAKAIVTRASREGAQVLTATDFRDIPGYGAVATVAGRRVLVGNVRL